MDPQTGQPVSYNSTGPKGRGILPIVILSVLLVMSLAFGGWSFSQMQSYKKQSDKKAAAAVQSAKKSLIDELQSKFDEQSKSPNKTFQGSATYGSVSFNYPKTWSAYVDTSSTSEPINAYFHPGEVPGLQSKTAYALRLELLSTDYSQVMTQFSSQVGSGAISAKSYLPPKLNGVANVIPGTLLSGQINSQDPSQKGTMLAIRVRDKTLEISTQSADYLNDFTSTVLPSLSFAP